MTVAEGLLAGVRVVEVGSGFATPLAARLLGDLGASVLKLEFSSGDPTRRIGPYYHDVRGEPRSALFEYLNWNKQSRVIEPAGDATRLAEDLESADLLLIGDDYHLLDQCGFTLDSVREAFPTLIVVAVTPNGLAGPKAGARSSDLTRQAASGLMSISGSQDREPLRRGLRMATYQAALSAAYAGLAALYHRRSGGHASVIDVSMVECISSELVHTVPDYAFTGAVPTRRPPIEDVLTTGGALHAGNGLVTVQVNSSLTPADYAAFLHAPELAENHFENVADRTQRADELRAILEQALARYEAQDFFVRSSEANLLTGVVQTPRDLLACPHLKEREIFATMPGLLSGRPWRMPRGPVCPPGSSLRRPAPALGEHPVPTAPTRPRTQCAASPRTVDGPLAGLRVLDLSTVFAAPYLCGLLADLGCDVIKVEAPARLDQTRGLSFGQFLDNEPGDDGWNWSGTFHTLNRGKRSLVLDLAAAEGRQILLRLIAESDILVENFTPRVMRGWGMTYERLAASNPALIMVSNTGYGQSGPWSGFKAQGTTLEATMGLTYFSGYAGEQPRKVGQSYPDFLAAWSGLLSVNAMLVSRAETGRGGHVDIGMYQLGPMMIPEALIAEQAGECMEGPQGNTEPGSLLSGVFPCDGEDEWVAVSLMSEGDLRLVEGFLGVPRSDTEDARCIRLHIELARWLAVSAPGPAATALRELGVAAERIAGVRDLILDEQFAVRRFFEWVQIRDDVRPMIGRPYRWSGDTTPRIRGRGPHFGEHNDAVLALAGQSSAQIAALAQRGVVRTAPVVETPSRPVDLTTRVAAGLCRGPDPDYLATLSRARSVGAYPRLTDGPASQAELIPEMPQSITQGRGTTS